jgi:DNA-binding beta-propeller fold protein YncE
MSQQIRILIVSVWLLVVASTGSAVLAQTPSAISPQTTTPQTAPETAPTGPPIPTPDVKPSGASVPAQSVTTVPSPVGSPTADPSTWPVFTPSVGVFSISYPRDWFVHEGGAISFSASAASSRKVSVMSEQPTLVLLRGDLAEARGLSPDRALHTWLQALGDNWDKADITVDWEAKVEGTPAGAAYVAATDRISGIAFRMYMVVFDLSGQQWLAMAVAPQLQWDAAWSVMKPMLSTLHALKPRPAAAALNEVRRPEFDVSLRDTVKGITPQDVAVGPNGWVYVLDSGNDRVQVYEPAGQLLFVFGARGAAAGQFDFIKQGALTVGPAGDVYVVDRGNSRVQVFAPRGSMKTIVGAGRLRSPGGIAVDSTGKIYVTDDESRSILVFDAMGQFAAEYTYQVQAGEFSAPKGIAVGPKDHLYIADPVAQAIVVLDNAGRLSRTVGGEAGRLSWPVAVKVAPDGTLFVADTELGQVVEFDVQGQPAAAFMADSGKSLSPNGLALDGQKGMYVCDAESAHLLKFKLDAPAQVSEPALRILNGNFADELTGWQRWIEPAAEAESTTVLKVLPTAGSPSALEMSRLPQTPGVGGVGVSQSLDIPLTGLKALYLTARVMVVAEEGDNIGRTSPGQTPEGAVMLRLFYRDKTGNQGEWFHGFYSRNTPDNDAAHFTTVPLEEWYPYQSENLLVAIPDLASVVRLQVYGYGRSFTGRVAAIQFTTQE